MKILCLTTGGTIAGNVADSAGHLEPEVLKERTSRAMDRMREEWGREIDLEVRQIVDIDSSNVSPQLWTDLALAIKEKYDEVDAFVITHGTNTMGYTCAALSFAIANSSKPIVITGSQIPFDWPSSDALMNLENAIRIAAYPYAELGGVVCVFGSHLITGVRAKKSTEFDIDAFQSFTSASIGRLGRVLDLNAANLARHQSYLKGEEWVPAITARDLVVKEDFAMEGLVSLNEFPGLSNDALTNMIDGWASTADAPLGVVFRAFGAGDVSDDRHGFLRHLKERRIPIVVTTQAPNGKSTFTVNDPGLKIKREKLAIPAHDMSIEAMTTKLGWLLAQNLPYEEINRLMTVDMHGEINVVADSRW